MRFSRLLLAASTVLSFAGATPAFADQNYWQSGAYENNADDKYKNAWGFFEHNATVFGLPDDKNKLGQFPNYGGRLDASVFRAQGSKGPCQGAVSVGNFEGYVQAGIAIDTTGPAGGSTYRGTGDRPSGRFNSPIKDKKLDGGGRGIGGLAFCKAGVEATVISLSGNCETPIGTIGGSVKGPGGQAECGCTGCFAEAYWAKAGLDYTTPKVGSEDCGFQVSASLGGEVMLGGALGAAAEGTIGGKVKVGPVGVKGSINVEQFDTGKMATCIVDAIEAVKEWDRRVSQAIANAAAAAGQRALSNIQSAGQSIANAGQSIANAASTVWNCIFGCSSSTPNPVAATSTAGNTPTLGGSTFPGGAYSSPGTSVALGATTVYTGSTVRREPTAGASGAGYAR